MSPKPPRRVDLIAQAFTARMFREIEQHVEQRAGFWLECVVAEMFPGESVELYGRKIDTHKREARDASVLQAIDAAGDGASLADLARRIGVPKTTLHRVKQRRRGTIGTKG